MNPKKWYKWTNLQKRNAQTENLWLANRKFAGEWYIQSLGLADTYTTTAGDAGDSGSTPGSGRSPGVGNDNPLQYSCCNIPWTEKPRGL